MTMFAQSQIPSNVIRIYAVLKLDGFWLGARQIYADFGLDFWLTTKFNGFWFGVSMVIDLITEWNSFSFFTIPLAVRNFGRIFCIVFRKISRIFHNKISTNHSPSLNWIFLEFYSKTVVAIKIFSIIWFSQNCCCVCKYTKLYKRFHPKTRGFWVCLN